MLNNWTVRACAFLKKSFQDTPYETEQGDMATFKRSWKALVLILDVSLSFSNHRKTSHHTVSARTTKQDIIKGMRVEGNALEYKWHILSDFCSSGIRIEIFARISSFACWDKVPSAAVSCFLILSSFCTNGGWSSVCFRGGRPRETERWTKWQMKSAQNHTWGCVRTSTWKLPQRECVCAPNSIYGETNGLRAMRMGPKLLTSLFAYSISY